MMTNNDLSRLYSALEYKLSHAGVEFYPIGRIIKIQDAWISLNEWKCDGVKVQNTELVITLISDLDEELVELTIDLDLPEKIINLKFLEYELVRKITVESKLISTLGFQKYTSFPLSLCVERYLIFLRTIYIALETQSRNEIGKLLMPFQCFVYECENKKIEFHRYSVTCNNKKYGYPFFVNKSHLYLIYSTRHSILNYIYGCFHEEVLNEQTAFF